MTAKPDPKKVKGLRLAKGYSQEKLAERAHVGYRTIQRIEDAHPVRPATLAAIASALGVGVSELITPMAISTPFASSLALERRAIDSRVERLIGQGMTAMQNPTPRVEIVEVAPSSEDGDCLIPLAVTELAHRLGQLGFCTGIGSWDSQRLLGKLPVEIEDTLYVIHRGHSALAMSICTIIGELQFGLRIVTKDSAWVSANSDTIPEESVLEYCDLLVAYRTAV